jgi:dUTP pyrophosphatase
MKFEVVDDKYRRYPNDDIFLPIRKTKGSAGYDFYTYEDVILEPKQMYMFWTDIKVKLDEDKVLILSIRSSLAKRGGIVLANGIGVVDSDYYSNKGNDGNIGFLVINNGPVPVKVNKGERIGQGMITKYFTVDEDISNQTRIGGFGSTK